MRWIVFVSLFLGVGCSAAATAQQPATEPEAPAARASEDEVDEYVDLVELENAPHEPIDHGARADREQGLGPITGEGVHAGRETRGEDDGLHARGGSCEV